MSSKHTHLIPSDIALEIWSLIDAGKQANTFMHLFCCPACFVHVIFNSCHIQLERYVLIHEHTFNCYFFLPL